MTFTFTDNLYRFIFFCGIALILFSFFRKEKLSAETSEMLYRQDTIINSLKGDEAVIKTFLDFLQSRDAKSGAGANLEKRVVDAKKELEAKRVEINNHLARANMTKERYQSSKEMAEMAYIVGLVMFGLGGLAWLFRIHIPQEKILGLQQKLLEIELKERQSVSHHLRYFNSPQVPFVRSNLRK